jgi:hypothetical protein
MEFDDLYRNIVPSGKSILELVDEFTLYCFYTGIDPLIPGKAHNSPYRQDTFPSFSIYHSSKSGDTEYMWKDHATGESGNIFKLIQRIEQLSTVSEVYACINEDFGLGYNMRSLEARQKIVWNVTPERNPIKIRVAEVSLTIAGLEFWDQFDIKKGRLNKYKTSQISWYWSYESQPVPLAVPDPTFVYRIGEYYQVYSPYANKLYKFRNDFPENYFFGYLQLPKTGKVLIIDKSCKDVIFCDRLGFSAVCGKSETTMIPHKKMLELKERFEEIYLMLDPDEAGRRQVIKYVELYPWLRVRFLEQAKDKTDLCKLLGINETARIIKELIH